MDSTGKISWFRSPILRQCWVVSSIFLNLMGQGMMFGISSSMLSSMQSPEADFRINMEVISWFGAMATGPTLLTLPIGSYLMKRIGRKKAYILMSTPAVIGLVIDACAYDVVTLLVGRFLCGTVTGNSGVIGLMTLGECTSPDYRGIFLMLKNSFFNLGILAVHLIGYYVHWRNVTFIIAAVFITSISIACTWPESPYWLAQNKKTEESEKSFYWLRGKTRVSTREFDEITRNLQNRGTKKTCFENIKEIPMKFRKKNFWKPFVIIMLAILMSECGGRHVFPTYAILIIGQITSSSTDPFYYNMALDAIITVSTFCSSYLIKICKLRKLLFTTGVISVVMLYLASLSLFLVSNETLSNEYSIISICLLGLFLAIVNLSCTVIPMSLGGEIFPIEHRAVGACVIGYDITLFATVMIKITPLLIEFFKIHGMLTCYASGLLLTLLGLYFMLPETKSKTLQEIDDYFTYGKSKIIRNYSNDHSGDRNKLENLLTT